MGVGTTACFAAMRAFNRLLHRRASVDALPTGEEAGLFLLVGRAQTCARRIDYLPVRAGGHRWLPPSGEEA